MSDESIENPIHSKTVGNGTETRGPGSGETSVVAGRSPSPPTLPFAKLPMEFGRYRVEKLLGSGAMGAVYLATDTRLDRQVALKVPRLSKTGAAGLLKRMEREAKALAQLDHPQICRVYGFDVIDDIRFMVLEYVQGETLKSLLQKLGRKRKPAEAVTMIVQLARALAVAHEKGVVHRDLKPENVMRRADGRLVIMDFGLNRQARLSEEAAERTQNGTILGTPAYMSPEQAAGKLDAVDQRSDIYALGVMLYEMLTGELPFSGSAFEIMGRKAVLPAPSPLGVTPDLSPDLADVCQRMLAQKAEDRYGTCGEVVTVLKSCNLTAQTAIDLKPRPADPPSGDPLDFLREPGGTGPQRGGASSKATPQAVAAGWSHRAVRSLVVPVAEWWGSMALSLRLALAAAACVVGVLLGTLLPPAGHDRSGGSSPGAVASIGTRSPSGQAISTAGSGRAVSEDIKPAPSLGEVSETTIGKRPGERRLWTSLNIPFRWCPPGGFRMGHPPHAALVDFSAGFWIAETELTQEHWIRVMKSAPWAGKPNVLTGPDYPAVYLPHGNDGSGETQADSASAFCNGLNDLETGAGTLPAGWQYRMPTEAEWEYACRAGTTTLYSFGDDRHGLQDHGWYWENTRQENYAHRVGTKPANPWGIKDMHGNVWEMCEDWGGGRLIDATDPSGPAQGTCRVHRGGGWAHIAEQCESATRGCGPSSVRYDSLGFRLVLSSLPVKERGKYRTSLSGGGDIAAAVPTLEPTRGIATPSPQATRPLEPDQPVDLLSSVQIPDHIALGKWSRTATGLKCDPSRGAKFMAPVAITGSYTLRCRLTRSSGNDAVAVILPLEGRQCAISLDSWEGRFHGLQTVNGREIQHLGGTSAAVQGPPMLKNGVQQELLVAVTSSNGSLSISGSVNGREFLAWTGLVSQVSIPGTLTLPHPRAVGIAIWNSSAEIHSLELTLAPDARCFRLGEDWQSPLSEVAADPPSAIASRCVEREGRRYFLSDRPMSLPDAQALAVELKGRLLTISSAEEHAFIQLQGRGRELWTAGWRPADMSARWRDERNRPLRYLAHWTPGQPNAGWGVQWNVVVDARPQLPGWHDAETYRSGVHACLEWGEEY